MGTYRRWISEHWRWSDKNARANDIPNDVTRRAPFAHSVFLFYRHSSTLSADPKCSRNNSTFKIDERNVRYFFNLLDVSLLLTINKSHVQMAVDNRIKNRRVLVFFWEKAFINCNAEKKNNSRNCQKTATPIFYDHNFRSGNWVWT